MADTKPKTNNQKASRKKFNNNRSNKDFRDVVQKAKAYEQAFPNQSYQEVQNRFYKQEQPIYDIGNYPQRHLTTKYQEDELLKQLGMKFLAKATGSTQYQLQNARVNDRVTEEMLALMDALPNAGRRKNRKANGGGIGSVLKQVAGNTMGMASGMAQQSFQSETGVAMPKFQNMTAKNPEHKPQFSSVEQTSMNAVNLDYVASVFDPQNHSSRQSTMEDIEVGLSNCATTFPVVSNGGGNCGVYIFCDNPTANGAGTTMTNCFWSILNNGTFDPNTGAQTGSPLNGAGPLNAGAANILKYKCTGFEVIFKPTQAAISNEGLVKCIHWGHALNLAMSEDQIVVIPGEYMENAPYKDCQSISNGDIRMVKVPSIADNSSYLSSQIIDPTTGEIPTFAPPYNTGFYFVFTGCVAGETIGTFFITYQYDFDPALSAIPYIERQLPVPGVMSIPAIINLFRMDKTLQNAPADRAAKVANFIKNNSTNSHDGLLSAFKNYLAKEKAA